MTNFFFRSIFSVLCFVPALIAHGAPIPAAVWAESDVLDASLSQNATYLSIFRAGNGGDGHPTIEVYSTDGELELVRRINTDPMEITGHAWVTDEHLVMVLRQIVRERIDGFNQGVFKGRLALVAVKDGQISPFSADRPPRFVNNLPTKPNKVLVSVPEADRWTQQYYEWDLKTGRRKLVLRSKLSISSVEFNINGDPVFGYGYDQNKRDFTTYWRPTPRADWQEILRSRSTDFDVKTVVGMDTAVPDHALVMAHNGNDTVGLWSFDLRKKEFIEPILVDPRLDIDGVRYHSNQWTNPDDVVGVVRRKDKPMIDFWDDSEAALYRTVFNTIESSFYLRIASRSQDGQSMIVLNSGPQEAPTYYLVHQNRVQVIGSRHPKLPNDALSPVRHITYKARDGRTIPGLLTVPKGDGPHPLIVVPHGGPFVSERVGFDPWAQMFANHGYMVLQPQYRGSHGYGLEHYKAAFDEKSEAGFAMQDDLDDGALHLVKEGLVDRDRLAMMGWSYGGYTSLVAAMREPQIYQCAIAGAAVSDPVMQVNYYRDLVRGAQKEEQVTTWMGAFSPYEHAGEVNIPLLLLHGELDQRVPVTHARKLIERMDAARVSYDYVEIEGIDHFYNTMKRRHLEQFYVRMLSYLESSCGYRGL